MLRNQYITTSLGIFGFVVLWYFSVEYLPVKAFNRLADPVEVIFEWFSTDPYYGISIFVPDYYVHIFYSTYRALVSFLLAVLVGVPLAIIMRTHPKFHDYANPLIGQ